MLTKSIHSKFLSLNKRMQGTLIKAHTTLVVLLSIALTAVSFLLALALRFDFNLSDRLTFSYVGIPLILLCVCRLVCNSYFKLNRGFWRFVSTTEAVDILKAHALSSLLFAAAVGIFRIASFPRSIIFLEFLLSLLVCIGARLVVRLFCERFLLRARGSARPREVVVIGAGVSGHLLVKTLMGTPNAAYRPVAIFDDYENYQGTTIHGIRVVGPIADLPAFLEKNDHVIAVIVACNVISETRVREIETICQTFHLPLKRLRSFEDIACQEEIEPAAPITVEQVLSRETNVEHEDEIREAIFGKRVLITGAGGSIGSELTRQALTFDPAQLILLDKSEFNLFSIEQELREIETEVDSQFCLVDVAKRNRLERIFRQYRPEIVLHAAAYKHVPLLETNVGEAFLNNIVGTRNVLEVSREYCTERFVLVSTDKAVDPTSTMGCTKRIAELMVAQPYESNYSSSESNSDATSLCKGVIGRNGVRNGVRNGSSNGDNGSHEKNGTVVALTCKPMNSSVVRFGNVINSAGSVIPKFKQQILEGHPITVTHPDVERYFMSIREAVRLVLTAGTLGEQGKIYILDMGQSIKIVDVAKKLLALYGRRDLPIVFTGLRAGEKMAERLHSKTERKRNTPVRKIFELESVEGPRSEVFSWVDHVEAQLEDLSDNDLKVMLQTFTNNTADKTTESISANVLQATPAANDHDDSVDNDTVDKVAEVLARELGIVNG